MIKKALNSINHMSQKGFEDYVYAVFDSKNGTAKSYITAIHIIDELFVYNDVFGLNGDSLTSIMDFDLLTRISTFVREQQSLYRKGLDSFFNNVNPWQVSYPGRGFCSAAMQQLLNYYKYSMKENEADGIITGLTKGTKVSKVLTTYFDIDRDGSDVQVTTKARLGQNYFRKMVLANYNNRCCVTGLNIPQILRASHIVAWAEDKRNRMNPENGLCLSATYDAAFDKHLISFDNDYRMVVSKEIKEYYTNDVVKEYFYKYDRKCIEMPLRFLPDKKLLEKHRSLLIE